ncbi:hypothetical protein A4H97_11065 [Niastella yeongjuensis]|uniref:Uncharacterized protein n=1 Tax=Niastella yeongjuensis TaxID=354355 RepID=A0A1V9EBE3_9BACT|nr:hypothetical protein [Niastella yeongjuensis]OQP43450.1 hypothetical protein A4H97_11065 [Niastella yeongjuensis]
MNKPIKSVWIESEEFGAVIEGCAPEDDNSDVIVTFTDNTRYIASFFTYTNIDSLRRKNERSGECLNGKYFWASDMILIDKINKESILSVVDYMIVTGEFYNVFKQLTDNLELQDHEAKE